MAEMGSTWNFARLERADNGAAFFGDGAGRAVEEHGEALIRQSVQIETKVHNLREVFALIEIQLTGTATFPHWCGIVALNSFLQQSRAHKCDDCPLYGTMNRMGGQDSNLRLGIVRPALNHRASPQKVGRRTGYRALTARNSCEYPRPCY